MRTLTPALLLVVGSLTLGAASSPLGAAEDVATVAGSRESRRRNKGR